MWASLMRENVTVRIAEQTNAELCSAAAARARSKSQG
jgi:hypothetical protein